MDKILPQLKKGVISSLLACRDQIMTGSHQTGHEIFGYDFMVDTSFNCWLLEVNSSPSMEHSSAITEKMCREVLFTLCDIAMAQEQMIGTQQDFSPNSQVGKF